MNPRHDQHCDASARPARSRKAEGIGTAPQVLATPTGRDVPRKSRRVGLARPESQNPFRYVALSAGSRE